MTPEISINRIVRYVLSPDDAEAINRRRTDGASIAARIKQKLWPLGAQAHIGNFVSAGDVFPAMVVKAMPGPITTIKPLGAGEPEDAKIKLSEDQRDFCSMQVFLDGTDVFWAENRPIAVGDHPELEYGTWHWPPRVG